MAGPSEPELAAVLTALAGVRVGDPVVAIGVGRITRAALAAGCGRDLVDPDEAGAAGAAVVVLGDHDALDEGSRLLRPGGRLVCLAADEAQARHDAQRAGVGPPFLDAVGTLVAWSARAPL